MARESTSPESMRLIDEGTPFDCASRDTQIWVGLIQANATNKHQLTLIVEDIKYAARTRRSRSA